ncbi:hypothetical protein STRIP9103_09309, partial [Streptomyces ipomoeae 91-03]
GRRRPDSRAARRLVQATIMSSIADIVAPMPMCAVKAAAGEVPGARRRRRF